VEGAKVDLRIKITAANKQIRAITIGSEGVEPLSGNKSAAVIAPITMPAFTATS
jgi:hypothetical protein